MDNNLPSDPPNGNNNNSAPPPFGSNFNPHTNPVDPNHPYASPPQSTQTPSPENEIHSEVAQHQHRNAHGRFVPENPNLNPSAQITPTPQTTPNPPNFPYPPIQVIQGGGGSGNGSNKSSDDPLFEAKMNNPFSKFFNWVKRLIKNQNVKISIPPLTAISIAVALTGGGGIIGGFIGYAFPHSSPILHRSVIYQGNLQRTPTGFILTLPNSDLYTLRPKANSSINFQSLGNGPVLVKGNLTPENFVIEASEIIPLGTTNPVVPIPTPAPATPSSQPSL